MKKRCQAAIVSFIVSALAPSRLAADTRYYCPHKIDTLSLFGNDCESLSLAKLGDVNANGDTEWALGNPCWSWSNPNRGKVVVFSGTNIDTPYATINGTTNDQRLGTSLVSLGDTNADGKPDLLIGEKGKFVVTGTCPQSPYGLVELRSGANLTGSPLWTISGAGNAGLGIWVANAHDIAGDSKNEFLISAPNPPNCSGSNGNVYLYQIASGSPSQLSAFSTTPSYGEYSNTIGDVNGDGYPDIAVNDTFWNGTANQIRLKIYSGYDRSLLRNLDLPATNVSRAGGMLSLEDINNDGYGDFAVSVPEYATGGTVTGAIYVYLGASNPSNIAQATGSPIVGATSYSLGGLMALLDDVDGDGVKDFLTNADREIRLYSSAKILDSNASNDKIGQWPTTYGGLIENLGDLDGDSIPDFAVAGVGSSVDDTAFLYLSDAHAPCETAAQWFPPVNHELYLTP
jgi:hypothetical protein